MKKLLLISLAVLYSIVIQAQAYQNSWAKNTNPATNIEASMILDSLGNSYIFGFSGVQGYLSKYDPSGTRIWQSNINNISQIGSAVVDRQGNVYVTGTFYGLLNFASDVLDAGSFSQMFIAKYDAAGTPVWAKIGGAQAESKGNHITLNAAQDQLYVAGLKKISSTFNSNIYSNNKNILVAKTSTDAQGTVLCKSYGHVEEDEAYFVKVDQNENVFVGGTYTSYIGTSFETADFDGQFVGGGDVNTPFIMKMSSSLIMSEFHPMSGKFIDELLIDKTGNLLVRGNDDNDRHYLTKLDNSFNTIWSVLGPLNDINGVGAQRANSIVINKEGNISWVGAYHLNSNNAAMNTMGTYQFTDISSTYFLAQLNASTGAFLTMQTEESGYVYGKCIGEDGQGNIYVFAREMDFSNEQTGSLGSDIVNDGFFLSKYKKPSGNVYVKYYTNPYSFTEQAYGSSRFMGNSVWCGQNTASKTFVLKNTGNRVLDLGAPLAFSFTGTNQGDYRVDTASTARLVNVGDSTTFTVIFDPLLPGNRTADLNIVSNDADENPYLINFYGTGVKQNQTITWTQTSYNAVYGSADVPLGATTDASGSITYSVDDNTVATIVNGNMLHFVKVGSAVVTANHPGNVSYNSASLGKNITVSKAQLTVTADDKTRSKGYANPTFTYTITGFKFSDNASVITGTPNLTCNANTSSAAGTYGIVVSTSGMSSTNYSFYPDYGVLTVENPPALTMKNITNNTTYTCSSNHNMGNIAVGDSVTHVIRILNTAASSVLNISSLTSNNSDFVLKTQGTDFSLNNGDTTYFSVTFRPTITGLQYLQLTMITNDPNRQPSCLPGLRGTGDIATGIVENTKSLEANVFPNPAVSGDAITVISSENIHGIYLYDMLGRSEFHAVPLLHTQLQGLLLVKILTDQGEQWTKIVVQP